MDFRFAYPMVLWVTIPLLLCFSYYLLQIKRGIIYKFPLTSQIIASEVVEGNFKQIILKSLRIISLFTLVFLAARPQWVDIRVSQDVDNIDIFLALDTSRSMTLIDDLKDMRRRFVVARNEAINFVQKRLNDRIGFGVFATDSLTLAPITDDKKFLQQIIESTVIGVVPDCSTALGKGLAMGVSRLKDSVAKSKIVIFLTDGAATDSNDFPVDRALELAVEKNVKIYTVGIGSEKAYECDHFGRIYPVSMASFDENLLRKIALHTGGLYFSARNPLEIQMAYEKIDQLEKTKQRAELFAKCDDIFWLLFIVALVSIFSELVLSVFIWKILG